MSTRPNVIVLILDTLRAKNVSSYGYPIRTTPHLDTFADQGIRFKRAISAATWTVPSHACLLTGLYISQHRIETIKGDRSFNDEIVTLPAALKSQGYRTVAFSQNMLFSSSNHLDVGFDEFHDVEELLGSRGFTRAIQRLADRSPRPVRLSARYARKTIAPRLLLDRMFDWIQKNDENTPFFAFANVLAPHFPWTLPPGFLPHEEGFKLKYLLKSDYLTLKKQWEFNSGKRQVTEDQRHIWRMLYDASVRHADSEIGRFLRRLDGWKGRKDTILIITSDHGEMMGDYRDIVGHVLSLNDNLIHVPLIIQHPDFRGGLEVEGVVQTLDLYPTLLEWCGVPASRTQAAQVVRPSLSRAIASAGDPSGFAFAEEDYTDSYDIIGKLMRVNPSMDPWKYPRQQIAIRSATHKFIWHDDRPGEFYNLAADPDEAHNLMNNGLTSQLAVLQELQRNLDMWRSGLKKFPPRKLDHVEEMDAVVLERLKDLGYVE